NYYIYRDTEGNGEWVGLPWDVDLSYGRNWNSTLTYWQEQMFPQNGLFVGGNNGFFNALFATPAIRQMYLRRIRTLMDMVWQAPNTPLGERKYETQMDHWLDVI